MTTTAGPGNSTLYELTTGECWEHLAAHSLGRIAFVDDDGPVLLPFNYLARDGLIWLRTTSYSHMAIHLPGVQVAFAVDHADERTRTGWSVLARGRAEHALDAFPDVPAGSPDPAPWPDGTRSMVFCLTPDVITGRVMRQGTVSPPAGHGPGSIQRGPNDASSAPTT